MLEHIEIGKKYRNIHTNIVAIVKAKIFFYIQYYEFKIDPSGVYPKYIHYKCFKKYWVKVK